MKSVLLICSVLLCSTTPALAAVPTVSTPGFTNRGANQVTLSLRSDAAGTGYFVLLPGAGATPGTGAQTKAGQNSTGAAAYRYGALPLTANTPGSYTIRNLIANTSYTVCFTADDGANLQPTCATASFTTTAATDLTGGIWVAAQPTRFTPGGAGELSLAFSAEGAPALAFRDMGPDRVSGGQASLMAFNGTAWSFVGSAGFSRWIPNDCNVVIAPTGQPYVAYADYSDTAPDANFATVMTFNGTAWVPVGVPRFTAGAAGDVTLAISPTGVPWIAFNEPTNRFKLAVMAFNGSTWVGMGASLSDDSAGDVELAFAPDGAPYVAFRDDARNSRASVIKYQGGSWQYVGSPGFVGGTNGAYYLSLAFAPDGTPYLAFSDFSHTAKACVVRFDGTAWVNVGMPDFSPSEAKYIFLQFAPDGQPWIGFRDEISGEARASVMAFDGTSWSVRGSRGISAGGVAESPLAFAPDGTPYVAFADSPDGKASVKRLQIPVTPTITSVDVPAIGAYATGDYLTLTVHFSTAVTMDGNGSIRLTIGSNARFANYFSGTGTTSLVFRYQVQSSDSGSVSVYNAPIFMLYGSIKNSVDNTEAVLTLNNVGSTAGVTIGTGVTPTITWSTPAAIVYGTALSATQLNATATVGATPVAGTFSYTPAAGEVLNAGANQTLSVAFTPTDTTTYTSASATTTITVNPALATVTLSGLSATYDGAAHAAGVATSPGGLPTSVTYGGSSTAPTSVGSYAVVATITASNYTGSASGTLVINKADQTITFGVPASRTVGDPAFTLTATASSGLAVSYASSNPGVATVSGSTVTVVGVGSTNLTASQGGNVSYNPAPDVVRSLTVNAAGTPTYPVARPIIVMNPASQNVAEGETVSLMVIAAGTGLSYQWRKDNADVVGARSNVLTLPAIATGSAGTYTVVVANSAGSVVSSAAVVSVAAKIAAPAITTQPGSQFASYGSTVRLAVAASGTGPFTYQWYKDNVAIAGATLATLTLSPARSTSAGSYTVAVTNAAGSTRSNAAVIAVASRGLMRAYLGTFAPGSAGNHRGTFALYLRENGTGIFLAYEASGRLVFVVRNVQLDAMRRFRFTMTPANSGGLRAAGSTAALSASETTVEGTIGPDGSISGSLGGAVSAALTAPEPPISSSPAELAGFYEAGVPGTSACGYFVVNDALQTFVVVVNGTDGDAASGTINPSGAFALTSENRAGIQGTINCQTATLTSKISGASGQSITCLGGNKDTRHGMERMINVSGRGIVTSTDPLISGFIISGTEPKRVLIRAVGPSLAGFGLRTALSAARLEVFQGAKSIAVANDWSTAPNATELASTAVAFGAFPLVANSHDAALLLTLAPGGYTAVVTGQGTAAGVAVAEVYDASPGVVADTERVINISSRANVGADDAALFSGFVVSGTVPKRVLIRGVGASLAQFGAKNALLRPELTLWAGQMVVGRNADWVTSADAVAIATAAADVGAFPLSSTGGDAALLIYLQPGAYCVQVSGRDGGAGVAVAEVYELP